MSLPTELNFICLAYLTEILYQNDQVVTLEAARTNFFDEKDIYETKNMYRLTSQKSSQKSLTEEVNVKSKIIKFIQKLILCQLLDKDTLKEIKEDSDDCDNPNEILELAEKIKNALEKTPALRNRKNNLRGVQRIAF